MFASMLRVKLHQARVTAADPEYVGSITIDRDLMEQTGIFAYERVLVVDIENGARLETYVIPGSPGSGEIQMNGAAARLVRVGDRLIIMAFALVPLPPPPDWTPCVAILDQRNKIVSIQRTGGAPCC